MDRTALEDELAELESVHRKLDEQIAKGYTNYLDDVMLGKMKQEKLVIKRSIANIRKQLSL